MILVWKWKKTDSFLLMTSSSIIEKVNDQLIAVVDTINAYIRIYSITLQSSMVSSSITITGEFHQLHELTVVDIGSDWLIRGGP
jgi:hypothetical protein